MNSDPLNRTPKRKFPIACVTFLAMSSLMPTVAHAGLPDGQWQGLAQQANTDVAIFVRFAAQTADIHFDAPFSCDVPARVVKQEGTRTIYRFSTSQNGGRFCDGLFNHDLAVTTGEDGRINLTFDSAKARWHGTIRRSVSPALRP